MNDQTGKIIVYYDGACPRCVKDRDNYLKMAGKQGELVCWFDITNREKELEQLGIDPKRALTELHLKTPDGKILSELDAYIMLMKPILLLKPLAWIISLPIIRPLLARWYHYSVERRLKKQGRFHN